MYNVRVTTFTIQVKVHGKRLLLKELNTPKVGLVLRLHADREGLESQAHRLRSSQRR